MCGVSVVCCLVQVLLWVCGVSGLLLLVMMLSGGVLRGGYRVGVDGNWEVDVGVGVKVVGCWLVAVLLPRGRK